MPTLLFALMIYCGTDCIAVYAVARCAESVDMAPPIGVATVEQLDASTGQTHGPYSLELLDSKDHRSLLFKLEFKELNRHTLYRYRFVLAGSRSEWSEEVFPPTTVSAVYTFICLPNREYLPIVNSGKTNNSARIPPKLPPGPTPNYTAWLAAIRR